MLAVGVTLAVLGILAVCIIIFATVRFRRRKNNSAESGLANGGVVSGNDLPSHRSFILDRNHFASRITPYSANTSASRPPNSIFAHLPGANMRVANRNSDGSWAFSASNLNLSQQTPITPPPPTATPTSRWRTKEMEAYGSSWSSYQKKQNGFDVTFETGSESDHHPPPAYYHPPSH